MKTGEKAREKTGEKTGEKIIRLIIENPQITQAELAKATALSLHGVEYNLKVLKTAGRLRHVGPDKGEHWEVVTPHEAENHHD